jgi:murein DD-endopeptidase MepM/ murein hydrolase activator NlpD
LSAEIIHSLKGHQNQFHPLLRFDPNKDRLVAMDLTESNDALNTEMVKDTEAFSQYITTLLTKAKALYGIGGYAEKRSLYSRSQLFDSGDPQNSGVEEPRRLHLGLDIWGPAGTPVFAFADGVVHSLANNDRYGDYGATLIVKHELDGLSFHTLYGHISRGDLLGREPGSTVIRGEEIAHFGQPVENGFWPSHLHFQVIIDLGEWKGDYPGVCKWSERDAYLSNCPDPDLILQWNQYL